MDGFIPVTKGDLVDMVKNSHVCLSEDYAKEKQKILEEYIQEDKKRASTPKWYLLGKCHKPRFSWTEHGVIAWSSSLDRPMFEGCPFKRLKLDRENSRRWLDSLHRVATSKRAGEPIQLDLTTFQRLNSPEGYMWVNSSGFKTIRY